LQKAIDLYFIDRLELLALIKLLNKNYRTPSLFNLDENRLE